MSDRLKLKLKFSVKFVLNVGRALLNILYDAYRFLRHANLDGPMRNLEQYEAWILKQAHRVEKGLVLPETRPFFGFPVLNRILNTMDAWPEYVDSDANLVALATMDDYFRFHEPMIEMRSAKPETLARIEEFRARAQSLAKRNDQRLTHGLAGRLQVDGSDLRARYKTFDMVGFAHSRYSVRQFGPGPFDKGAILRAVQVAQKAPSVCNRQTCKVYVLTEREDIDVALTFQNGNRGFGNRASALLIVTSDLDAFSQAGERYQGWVDGGLFAMSLIFGLHAEGIASCCLNWSTDAGMDRKFRKSIRIPASENVVMYIACGNYPDDLEVARSPRASVEKISIWYKSSE